MMKERIRSKMAERRMFTKKVTDDESFYTMPSSSQLLYFHLSMCADDDGFNNQVSLAMFKAHASATDLQLLLERRFLYQFENGVIVITHWRMANALRKDRYTETVFRKELALLDIDDSGTYVKVDVQEEDFSGMTQQQIAYKKSSLPYSFEYKIKQVFWGRPCPICGVKMAMHKGMGSTATDTHIPSIQHNMPISKGGEHELGNISIICKKCNVSIRDKITDELNAKEVIEEWKKISGCRLVASCLPQDSIGKESKCISHPNKYPIEEESFKDVHTLSGFAHDITEIVEYLNAKCGTRYKASTPNTRKFIQARLNEGFKVDDFKRVIDNMYAAWHDDQKMAQYLRPQTLFGTKFESYLNRQDADDPTQSYLDKWRDA